MCYVLWHSLITLPGDSWKERRGETWNMQKQQVLGERCFGKLFIGFLETFITQVLSFKGSELETCAFCNVTTGEEAICRFAAVLGQQQYPMRCVILWIFFDIAVIKIENHTKVTSIGSTLCCPSVEHLKLVQSNQAVIDECCEQCLGLLRPNQLG